MPAEVTNEFPSHTSSNEFSVFHRVVPTSGVAGRCPDVPYGIATELLLNLTEPYNLFLNVRTVLELFKIVASDIEILSSSSLPVPLARKSKLPLNAVIRLSSISMLSIFNLVTSTPELLIDAFCTSLLLNTKVLFTELATY